MVRTSRLMRPRVTIVMTTFAPHGELGPIRIEACRKAIASLQTHIVYDGQLALHVADDGSAPRLQVTRLRTSAVAVPQ